MKLKSWWFILKIDQKTDAHNTLVKCQAARDLLHLFTPEQKSIVYHVIQHQGQPWLCAKSCIAINDPIVREAEYEVTQGQPVNFLIRVYANKIRRPPNLKYELASISGNERIRHEFCGWEEVRSRLGQLLKQSGLSDAGLSVRMLEPFTIQAWHKHSGKSTYHYAMDTLVSATIIDVVAFEQAWKHGVGAKRVYGFGGIRLEGELDQLLMALEDKHEITNATH